MQQMGSVLLVVEVIGWHPQQELLLLLPLTEQKYVKARFSEVQLAGTLCM